MHDSKLPLSTWALAFYLVTTNIKGISSMKLHRDLGITQKTAWHLAHRIRETYNEEMEKFGGPVEADETYVGGQNKNRHRSKRVTGRGRGTVGKAVVAGLRDRETNQVLTQVVDAASRPILKEFVEGHTQDDALIYTDEWAGYGSLNRRRESVSHSAGEYVRGMASTNGFGVALGPVQAGPGRECITTSVSSTCTATRRSSRAETQPATSGYGPTNWPRWSSGLRGSTCPTRQLDCLICPTFQTIPVMKAGDHLVVNDLSGDDIILFITPARLTWQDSLAMTVLIPVREELSHRQNVGPFLPSSRRETIDASPRMVEYRAVWNKRGATTIGLGRAMNRGTWSLAKLS